MTGLRAQVKLWAALLAGLCGFAFCAGAQELLYVSKFGATPNDGIDDRAAISNTISYAKTNGINEIYFEEGVYDLFVGDAALNFGIWIQDFPNLSIIGAADVSGNPATTLLRHYNMADNISARQILRIDNSANFTLKNVIFDNTPRYMTAGEVLSKDANGINIRVYDGNPLGASTKFYCANLWDANTRNLKQTASLTFGSDVDDAGEAYRLSSAQTGADYPVKDTFIIEAESFQVKADWSQQNVGKNTVLNAIESDETPLTVVPFVRTGQYYVWASSVDFATDRPRTRTYNVFVDDVMLPAAAGMHGRDGVYWELLGVVDVMAGDVKIHLKRKTSHSRCDALLFTMDSDLNPNETLGTDPTNRAAYLRTPISVTINYQSSFPGREITMPVSAADTLSIDNGLIKMTFTQRQNADSENVYVRSVSYYDGGVWTAAESFGDESLFYIYSAATTRGESPYFCHWTTGSATKTITLNGQVYTFKAGNDDPFCAGAATLLRPSSVVKLSDTSVKISYVSESGATAESVIELVAGTTLAKMNVTLSALPAAGYYSIGFLGFNKRVESDVSAVELPTIYQGRRMMETPRMIVNHFTSQPLAFGETSISGVKYVNGFVADPAKLPFAWTTNQNSVYGFSLKNPEGTHFQTSVFAPLLGGTGSYKAAGASVASSWYLFSIKGDWMKALETANEKIFAAGTLREPYDVSLSDTLCNIASYLKAGSASGWSARNKGRWNIEAASTSTHASPLSELSVALVTDDEEYYKNFSLPTIEFTLSRRHMHFSPYTGGNSSWFSDVMTELSATGVWGGDYYAGVNGLLRGANPWLSAYYRNANGTAKTTGVCPEWTALLAIYCAEPSAALLAEIKTKATSWLATAFSPSASYEPDFSVFINVSLYPFWWHLVSLYEITGEQKYLDAAEKGAFHTLSSMWAYPTPPAGNVSIYSGKTVVGVESVWWRGPERYRLGYDENKALLSSKLGITTSDLYYMPTKTVPAMKVSRIGLGIEQHSTYPGGTSHGRNILMPGWAGEMLKVSQYTGRDIIFKYSRHAIVGRYGNFPGYYVRDFTDIQHAEDYPYVGPDITSFYYHHAPCHYGQVFDYIMGEIEMRSSNKIKFPFMIQQGYVWFVDRIFGLRGKVFQDENCRLILDKAAVRSGTPKVSTMLMRAPDGLWAVFLNDSASALTITPTFNLAAKALEGVSAGAAVSLYDANGAYISALPYASPTLSVPALGLAAIKIAANAEVVPAAPAPLTADRARFTNSGVGGSLGDLNAYRIRGPFGKDSFFAFFSGKGTGNQKIYFFINRASGGVVLSQDSYPYEFSFYGLEFDEDVTYGALITEEGVADIIIGSVPVESNWLETYYASASDLTSALYGDTDGDGQTGMQEYVCGTNPLSKASKLSLNAVKTSSGAVLEFEALAGRTYKILWSDDLKTWSAFISNGEKTAVSDGVLSFTDDYSANTTGGAPAANKRFYKLEASK